MRYPKFLPDGGSIGFIAPSFGCAIEPYKERFENARRILKEKGYDLILGPNCFEDSGVGISNTPEKCGAELNAYMTGNADAIITCGGGELMCEVVPYIDFDAIKKAEPKWYMGYSDNTNYTFLSTILADTAAIYGPCAPAFGREPWHKSLDDALKLLRGESLTVEGYDLWELYEPEGESDEQNKEEISALAPYNVTEKEEYKYYTSGKIISGDDFDDELSLEGRLIGGCLDILTLHTGTKYDKVSEFIDRYKDDKIIWFIECCDLDMLSMRRALWNLREAGWFRNAGGFLMGRPRRFGEDIFGVNEYTATIDILGELGVPIIMDLDIGHLPPMMPIISGSYANIKASGNNIRIDYIFR